MRLVGVQDAVYCISMLCLIGYVILVIALCCAHAWLYPGLVKYSCLSVSHPCEPTFICVNRDTTQDTGRLILKPP